MMTEVKTERVRLPEELVNYLQRLDYEVNGLRVLHTHALSAGAPAEEIRERFQEKFAEYQLAKQEMWSKFGGGRTGSRWWVDFQEGVLHIVQG